MHQPGTRQSGPCASAAAAPGPDLLSDVRRHGCRDRPPPRKRRRRSGPPPNLPRPWLQPNLPPTTRKSSSSSFRGAYVRHPLLPSRYSHLQSTTVPFWHNVGCPATGRRQDYRRRAAGTRPPAATGRRNERLHPKSSSPVLTLACSQGQGYDKLVVSNQAEACREESATWSRPSTSVP